MRTKIHTMIAITNAVAKSGPPKPSWNPTAVARAVTVAEWDDGIPPDPTSCFGSHLFSLYLQVTLHNWLVFRKGKKK